MSLLSIGKILNKLTEWDIITAKPIMTLCSVCDDEADFCCFDFYRICCFLPLSCTYKTSYEEAVLLLLQTRQNTREDPSLSHHSRGLGRVKQTCHALYKDCDFLVLTEGCWCLNGYKWRSCSSSENTERRIGSASTLSDLLGGIFSTYLLSVAAFPLCLVSSVYPTRH